MAPLSLKRPWASFLGWLTAPLLFCAVISAQTTAPKTSTASVTAKPPAVTKIDEKRFAELIKPSGKPLLINFWATWCEPCRDEFPDLVKIDAEYKGKIDFITISLDFEEELNSGVPKFLAAMKATMPTYLLITPDETAAISMISKDWSGGLPMTVLYSPDGKLSYFRQGIVRHDILQKEIDKALGQAPPYTVTTIQTSEPIQASTDTVSAIQIVELPLLTVKKTADDGARDALRDLALGNAKVFVYGFGPGSASNNDDALLEKYGVGFRRSGCFVPIEGDAHATAYNRTVLAALKKKHGEQISQELSFVNQ